MFSALILLTKNEISTCSKTWPRDVVPSTQSDQNGRNSILRYFRGNPGKFVLKNHPIYLGQNGRNPLIFLELDQNWIKMISESLDFNDKNGGIPFS